MERTIWPSSRAAFPATILRAAACVAVAALALAVFFRVQILSGFGALWGNRLDGGIEAAILEHWYNVVRGTEVWNRTAWFFPATGTLGYNDGYVLYGLLHAAFRAVGADIYVASALVDMAVKAIGFAGMFLLLRRVFACRFAFALFGAALFTLSHGSFQHALHQQLLSVAFLPVLALLAWEAAQALAAGQVQAFVAWGGAAGVLWGAWLLTAFYASWFATFYACVLAAVSAVVLGRARMAVALRLCRSHPWACAAVAAITLGAVMPFLVVYLPKLRETGGQSWRETLFFTPKLNDLVNLGPDNTLWGRFHPVLCARCTADNFEMTTGFTPILFWLFVASTLWLVARRPGHVLLRITALAVVAVLLLMLRWGPFTPWWLVWKLVPGAGGLRVVSRLMLFLAAPVIVVATVYLQHLAARVPRHLVVLLALLVLAEQARPGYTMYGHQGEVAQLDVPAPPAGCRAFYITAAEGSENPGEVFGIYPHNVKAMLVAELIGLPTINGHSTFDPPDWDFAYPLRPDYEDRIRAYAARHAIAGLCRLDGIGNRWSGPG